MGCHTRVLCGGGKAGCSGAPTHCAQGRGVFLLPAMCVLRVLLLLAALALACAQPEALFPPWTNMVYGRIVTSPDTAAADPCPFPPAWPAITRCVSLSVF
jgi:hypothetical protein